MRSFTRLIFGMALAAAAPATSLLVMTYSQDAAAMLDGVALNGTSFNGVVLNVIAVNGIRMNGARMNDAVGVADPNRLRLRAIHLPGE